MAQHKSTVTVIVCLLIVAYHRGVLSDLGTVQNNNNNNTTTPMMTTTTTPPTTTGPAVVCRNGGSYVGNGGDVRCQCLAGWTGVQCDSDVDECNSTAYNKCASDAKCLNFAGGYNCSCNPGYAGDGWTCKFVNPCTNALCYGGTCLSMQSSYQCLCNPGWKGNDCGQDIDECTSNRSVCTDVNSQCRNTNGSYVCNCIGGFFRNSFNVCTELRLWPFGFDNVILAKGRNSKMTVDVTGGFPFYGRMHYQIQISSSGYITFGPSSFNLLPPLSYSGQFPINISMLAPYWSDMETSPQNDSMVAVDVYNFWNATLNLTNSEIYAALVARTVQFSNVSFEPWFAVVTTWRNVVPYPAKIYTGFENATFQVILATDGNRSVAFVNYAASGMQWNSRSDNRTIVIGMTDGTGIRFNFTGDVYHPDVTVGVGTGKLGQFFFDLGQPISNHHLPCLKWYQMPSGSLMTSKMDALVPCPCSLEQALNDPRYVNDSASGLCVRHRLNINAGVNICCYDSIYHALIVGLGGGYLRSNGALEGWQKCCIDADLCQLFYMKQTSDNCQKYLPPATAAIWGDPSISPFVGEDFVFNGYGEYSFLRLSNGQFLMQGRFESRPNATSINATSLTSVAMQAGNQSALEVQLKDGALRILASGQTFPLPWTGGNLGGAVVESSDNLTIQLHFEETDILFQFSVVMDSLRLKALLPKSVLGWNESTGLLFKRCNGTYPQVTSDSDKYNYFRTCQLTKIESIFLYSSDGYDYDLVNNQSFVPTFISLNFTVAPFCGTSKSCIREYMITMDQTRALAAKDFEDGIMERKTKLANFPPVFSSTQSSVLYALIGQELNFALNVTDPEGKPVRFNVDTVINQTEWQMNGNIFIWKPLTAAYNTSSVKAFLQFHATDDANSSSLYWPFVHLCPCSIERGRCIYDDYPPQLDMKTAQGRLVIGRCNCLPGWTGDFCGQSVDVCSPSPCFPGVNCSSNRTDTVNGYTCASCPPGLENDGSWCYDVNECLAPPGNACSTCVNLLGTYNCMCDKGYTLSQDQKTCIDVDECTQRDICVYNGQYCHNLPGSYECLCRPDYFTNGSTCVYAPIKFGGKITFKTFNVTSSLIYVGWLDSMSDASSKDFKMVAQTVESLIQKVYSSVIGFVGVKATQLQKGSIVSAYDLFFQEGSGVNASDLNKGLEKFLLDQNCRQNAPDCVVSNLIGVDINMSNVYDKDLCVLPMDNMCDAKTMNCHTENGQALCICKNGFRQIAEYIGACEDIDECLLGLDNCNASMNVSTCINTPGSYMCGCIAGFQMYNGSCKDICQPNPCANGGNCVVRGREYMCECVGIWDGLNCTEENQEAIRLRKVAIGLGVGLGILCLILIVLLIAICLWHYRNGTSYTCASVTSPSNGSYKGRRSVNVHQWNADEMEFQTNGSHHDQDQQPGTVSSTGRENPSYTSSTLELNRSSNNANKTSSEYF